MLLLDCELLPGFSSLQHTGSLASCPCRGISTLTLTRFPQMPADLLPHLLQAPLAGGEPPSSPTPHSRFTSKGCPISVLSDFQRRFAVLATVFLVLGMVPGPRKALRHSCPRMDWLSVLCIYQKFLPNIRGYRAIPLGVGPPVIDQLWIFPPVTFLPFLPHSVTRGHRFACCTFSSAPPGARRLSLFHLLLRSRDGMSSSGFLRKGAWETDAWLSVCLVSLHTWLVLHWLENSRLGTSVGAFRHSRSQRLWLL